jgi:hypothetical protein
MKKKTKTRKYWDDGKVKFNADGAHGRVVISMSPPSALVNNLQKTVIDKLATALGNAKE